MKKNMTDKLKTVLDLPDVVVATVVCGIGVAVLFRSEHNINIIINHYVM